MSDSASQPKGSEARVVYSKKNDQNPKNTEDNQNECDREDFIMVRGKKGKTNERKDKAIAREEEVGPSSRPSKPDYSL